METAPRVDELLSVREQQRTQGQTLSPEELCRDCPELLDQVRYRLQALAGVEPLVGPGACPSTKPELEDQEAGAFAGAGAEFQTLSRYRVERFHASCGINRHPVQGWEVGPACRAGPGAVPKVPPGKRDLPPALPLAQDVV